MRKLAWVNLVSDKQQSSLSKHRPKQHLLTQEKMYYTGPHNHEIIRLFFPTGKDISEDSFS